jgi:hypothetical protein
LRPSHRYARLDLVVEEEEEEREEEEEEGEGLFKARREEGLLKATQ